jgi:hypothetical protein
MRNELIRREKQHAKGFNLISKTMIFCQEKNIPVYVMWTENQILPEISTNIGHHPSRSAELTTKPSPPAYRRQALGRGSGDGQVAGGALERDLITSKFKRLCLMRTLFPSTTLVKKTSQDPQF